MSTEAAAAAAPATYQMPAGYAAASTSVDPAAAYYAQMGAYPAASYGYGAPPAAGTTGTAATTTFTPYPYQAGGYQAGAYQAGGYQTGAYPQYDPATGTYVYPGAPGKKNFKKKSCC
ncbi:unnamed protein product [Vitrella brassicaformis CCMP3155]|uniref:Uncharacterized protein n=1 Tax=Vitrella brassicaformis (strain CCMP3155) TaxID=1169540 RepID=A0A0G4EGE7_VITBC|nr:unnamed protein product [Vitrella brassicaformis CCMP3155]|mmetsp:Transcript_45658/g.113429  ORF Transcript_45658/g.113429 Transcript_45658/m.113429 type:complete len:117 (-) Transcript_45658:926-1276(-)|eukprot:CEL94846.1 unnamed protein product [Vitrella brassicaformis CCMP3155]